MPKTIKIKIELNKNLCISCGVCSALAPNAFEYDQTDGKYKVKDEYKIIEVTQEQFEQLKQVQDACPVQAIKITILEE